MTITCLGATREVTGSCYLLETSTTRILIDCGLFQGGHFCEESNQYAWPFDASTVDAVIVTHAHLDHTGRLPLLVARGFHGPIFLTPPTRDLTELVLHDALGIMREDFKRHQRAMLYQAEDLTKTIGCFQLFDYDESKVIGDLTVRFREAGHIFGSAFVEIVERGGARVVFSGDMGNQHVPILRETANLSPADIVFIESTYGNRIHEDESTRTEKLHTLLKRTVEQNGVLLIPAFAIERTQQLLYELHTLVEHQHVPPISVYLDSPMAIETSKVIARYPQYYNQETFREVTRENRIFDFPGLRLTYSRDESKLINQAPKPKVIIAGAGMMNGGRILHHLVRYLGEASTTVLIVGYQAQGTLGHALYEGARQVEVLSEHIEVKAQVESVGAYSAHADMHKLLAWIGSSPTPPSQVYCTHGDEGACVALASQIAERYRVHAQAPKFEQIITL